MKIWKSNSVEHSANLRIIGTFKTVNDAQSAAESFNRLLQVENKNKGPNNYFSDELMEACKELNFHSFSEYDPEQLDLFSPIDAEGNQIIVDTDELEIQALLKVLISKSAKIEIYSKHAYPG